MSSSSVVKILETAQIKPISARESSLPVTFFDTFWFKLPPVERLFFYNLNNLTHAYFSSDLLSKLKQSLSLTLNHFLPLAGNLRWTSNAPKPFISYTPNDENSLTVAESDADFHRLTDNGVYEAIELHPPADIIG
ncbi:hypothetical protein like AT5G39080 [Hibiscus trionum]|uniref:Anthocyanin acyltransferase n=1 Tax=Hibiscus trionum TaxID=183268 RepID=A0A9W7H6N8_HIBTR|nr:hypothetical protein like AT5G39080 [Hibiscus trionum]